MAEKEVEQMFDFDDSVCDKEFESCLSGNLCMGCNDYDLERDICLSDGGCGRPTEE